MTLDMIQASAAYESRRRQRAAAGEPDFVWTGVQGFTSTDTYRQPTAVPMPATIPMTAELLFRFDGPGDGVHVLFSRGSGAGNRWVFYLANGSLAWRVNGTNPPALPLTVGRAYHAIGLLDGDNIRFGVQGVEAGSASLESTSSANIRVEIGARDGGQAHSEEATVIAASWADSILPVAQWPARYAQIQSEGWVPWVDADHHYAPLPVGDAPAQWPDAVGSAHFERTGEEGMTVVAVDPVWGAAPS